MTVKELDDKLKEIFKELQAYDISTVYEKDENSEDYKLVVFFNKIFFKEVTVLYTKFIFFVDSEKINVTKDSFLYLFDINCLYKNVEFTDLDDMKNKIDKIFKNERFGPDLKVLSKFIEAPATSINDWFATNNVKTLSVHNVQYSPKIKVIPCKSLFFSFKLDINGTNEVELTITKERSNLYNIDFHILNDTISLEKSNLNSLIETIGTTLKNKLT